MYLIQTLALKSLRLNNILLELLQAFDSTFAASGGQSFKCYIHVKYIPLASL